MRAAYALLALPSMGWAFPQLMGASSRAELEAMLKEKREAELAEELARREAEAEPQLLGGLIGSVTALTNDIGGLLGSVAASVDPNNKRPEPGYVFKAPGPDDSRGPCPGLNLLANYGYLPRNGLVTYAQVLEATARGFNMGADLATVLSVFAVLTDGDIATESWYLGTNPNTKVGGLNRHSTVEADISPNREDYYNGCGDNHHLSSRLFRNNVYYAATSPDKDFGLYTMGSQYAGLAKFSQQNNPYLYFFPFPMIVSLGAFAFYPNFFSNGTYGSGGVANYESISSIIGAKYDSKTGQFEYVPERWPENWYRRSTPYGAVQTLTDGYTSIYTRYPLVPGIAQFGGPNLNAQTILCDLYQGIQSITPLALGGTEEQVAAAVSWALGKLAGVGLSNTVLGCSTSTLSPNFPIYPNQTNTGGPLNPPPHVAANTGNNVYNKVYFETAPVTPQCNHVYNP